MQSFYFIKDGAVGLMIAGAGKLWFLNSRGEAFIIRSVCSLQIKISKCQVLNIHLALQFVLQI